MTRLITYPVHGAIEIALATVLMAAPFVFGFGAAGLLTSVAIGAVMMGLALGTTGGEGRGTIPVGAHAAYDVGIALGLLLAALLLGIAGDGAALSVLTLAAVVQIALNLNTRYTAVRA